MRNRILFGVGVASLAFLLTAEPALAQRGVRGGGGRAVGGRAFVGGRGVYAGRAYYGGYRGVYAGRGYYGGYRGYYRPNYARWGAGFFGLPYYGLGYGYPYNYGGYYPYAAGYVGGPGSYAARTYGTFGPVYAANTTNTYQSFYAGPQGNPNSASIQVVVPDPNAQVMFDGTPTQQRGTNRSFVTPPLNPDKESHYTITATWTENGQSVTRDRRITVQPGARVRVDFTEAGGNMPSVPD
jgi:uncharacterized protein (TIGR03000 family)